MPASTFVLLVVIVFIEFSSGFASGEQRNITAEPGHDVTLPCRAGDGRNIEAVEWTRPDLGSEYVLSYRNKRLETDHQHPSFQQRVDLQDRQMKDGDVSLILKKVTTDDTGTYECRVFQKRRNKRFADTKSIFIHLEVSPSGRTQDGGDEDGGDEDGGDEDGGDEDGGDKDGGDEDGGDEDGGDEDGRKQDGDSREHLGLIVGLSVVGIIVMVVGVGVWIFKKKNSAPPPDVI